MNSARSMFSGSLGKMMPTSGGLVYNMKKYLLRILITSIFLPLLFDTSLIYAQSHQQADQYFIEAQELEKQGNYLEAAKMSEKAVREERKSSSPRMDVLASELNQAGSYYYLVGQYDKAIEYYKEALGIDEGLENEAGIARDLNSLGMAYNSWDKYEKAINCFEEALEINRKLGMDADAAVSLNNIGLVYDSWGHYDRAIAYYEEALVIDKKLENDAGIAISLNNIGMVYSAWGKYDKAITCFEESLAMNNSLGQDDQVAVTLNNIGYVYDSRGQYDKAIEYYEKALVIDRRLGREASIAEDLNNIGMVYDSYGLYDKAITYFEEALSENERMKIDYQVATNLNNIGSVYTSIGHYDKAIEYFEEALNIDRKLGRKADIALDLNNIGAVYNSQGEYKTAIRYYLESIAIIEELRKTATGDIRMDYLASQIVTYQGLTSAYIRDSNISAAFRTIELSRAKLLTERLSGDESEIRLPEVSDIQRSIGKDTVVIVYANVGWEDMVRITISSDEITGKEVSVKSFIQSSIASYEEPIMNLLENQRGVKVVKKTPFHTGRVEAMSDFDNIINYYRSLIMNTVSEDARGVEVVGIEKFKRVHMEKTGELAKSLYELLIDPLDSQIKDKKNMIIVPDGTLAFIPFETLIDRDGKYLVEEYRVSYVQSMGTRELIRKREYREDRKPLLAFGGAVYDEVSYDVEMVENEKQLGYLARNLRQDLEEERGVEVVYSSLGVGPWKNLPGTLSEVRNIKKVVKKSDIFTGTNVSEKNIKELSANGTLSDYKVLHFATHGLSVPEIPELSAVVLSQFKDNRGREDGYLRMGEIASLDMKADLVNLSACDTGLGKLFGGEGVVGLTQSFLIAGANAVSVSLWRVEDESTSQFMVSMYGMAQDEDVKYVDAMAEVKRRFISGDFGEGYKAPYYWAPFVYYGRDYSNVKEKEEHATEKHKPEKIEPPLEKEESGLQEKPGSTVEREPLNIRIQTRTYDNGEYTGEYKDDKRHGQGTYTWHDGLTYTGEWEDDKVSGQGTKTWPEGDRYVGTFRDYKLDGHGTYTFPDGTKYIGEWKDDRLSGQGTKISPDGDKYTGAFKDYAMEGYGTYTGSDGAKYAGEWKSDRRHGQGTYTGNDGDEYAGGWENDEMSGYGVRTWPDGNKYTGEWSSGKMNGQGTFVWADGTKYVGEWNDGEMYGYGTKIWTNGEKYVGEWKNFGMEGYGTYNWPDGGKYVGEWKDNRMHGQGTRTWIDGSKYVGEYKDDIEAGGWYYWPNGTKGWTYKDAQGNWVSE